MISSDMPLAEFLGIHHADSHTPAFIYSGHLQSIGSYVSQVEDKMEFIPRSLMDIAEGLNYIHTKGLVHMEISVSTVTVSCCCIVVYSVEWCLLPLSTVYFTPSPGSLVGSDEGCQSRGCEFESQLGQHSFRRFDKSHCDLRHTSFTNGLFNSLCGKAASCLESMLCGVLVWENQETHA